MKVGYCSNKNECIQKLYEDFDVLILPKVPLAHIFCFPYSAKMDGWVSNEIEHLNTINNGTLEINEGDIFNSATLHFDYNNIVAHPDCSSMGILVNPVVVSNAIKMELIKKTKINYPNLKNIYR